MSNTLPLNNQNGTESTTRSFAKAVSWRLVAFVVLGVISYLFTGSWKETTLITLAYNIVQIFVYFAHERVWDRIRWGRPDGVELPHADELEPAEAEMIREHLRELGYIE